MKKYQIIYADPPWAYNDRRNKHTRFCGGAMVHYSTMNYKDISKLRVDKLADKNGEKFENGWNDCLEETKKRIEERI